MMLRALKKLEQIRPKKSLPGRQVRAALFLAEDKWTDERIAREVGVTRGTLAAWKRIPAFAEEVNRLRAEFERKVFRSGIANWVHRLEIRNQLCNRLLAKQQEQADYCNALEAQGLARIPGGKTGLVMVELVLYKGAPVFVDGKPYYRRKDDYRTVDLILRLMRDQAKEVDQRKRDRNPGSGGEGRDKGMEALRDALQNRPA
jgi:hypothetical protein